jgi:branched-chain amino acid transport system substrate-binding protein
MKQAWIAVALATALAGPAQAADRIKIGFLSTMTGPGAVLGKDMANGAALALDRLGGRMAGVPAELLVEDDQQEPQVGIQKAQKLLERDKVDVLAGTIFGNVTQAVVGVAKPSGVIMVATVGAIPQILGPECHENHFTMSWIIDANYEAVGNYLNDRNVRSAALMVPNYVAGKLVTDGFKRTFKGEIKGEIYTKLNQPDYSVELAQVRSPRPEAVVVFYPGGMGINFLKQYKQAGMMEQMPVYSSVFIADESTFPALGDIPLGMVTTSNWSPELDNAANREFVSAYVARHGTRPTSMAAMGFDTIMLIAAAARDAQGKVEDRDRFRAALRQAKFESVRGAFRFNHNHFPIQSYYVNQVAKDAQGKLYNKLVGVALRDVADAYHAACPMKW